MKEDAFDIALRRALARHSQHTPVMTADAVAEKVRISDPRPPRKRGTPSPNSLTRLEIPRHAWPRVHDTIRAKRLPVETLKDAPPGRLALRLTRSAADALALEHPELAQP